MKMSALYLNEQHVRNRREELLQRISTDPGLPTLGVAVSKVINMASTGEKSVNQLAQFVLSDVGLTQNILRLANSVSYRSAQTTPVTTISKAIFILGFDTVKTSALAMLMLERFTEQDQVLHNELTHALCASIMARECVSRSLYQDAEEATVAALFKNIGRVLLAVHAPDMFKLILQTANSGLCTINQAAFAQLGCGLEHFGASILQSWGMPDTIVQSIAILPPGVLKKSAHRGEWQKQVAAFSYEAAGVILQDPRITKEIRLNIEVDYSDDPFVPAAIHRYGAALDLDAELLIEWLNKAAKESQQLAQNLGMRIEVATPTLTESPTPDTHATAFVNPDNGLDYSLNGNTIQSPEFLPAIPPMFETTIIREITPVAPPKVQLPDEFLMSAGVDDLFDISPDYPSGKPANACAMLLTGVIALTQTIAGGHVQLNQLVMQLLDTLHKSLGFRFTTACLKETKGDRYIARISIGDNWQTRQKNFSFPVMDDNDLFHLAIKNNADLIIADVTNPKIARLLPDWYSQCFSEVQSIMILPLIVKGKAIGLLYADRIFSAPEGIPADEAVLIKTMKGQLLAVMGKTPANALT